ncbi:hypothetical protein D3C76_1373550 [compost metagenome]
MPLQHIDLLGAAFHFNQLDICICNLHAVCGFFAFESEHAAGSSLCRMVQEASPQPGVVGCGTPCFLLNYGVVGDGAVDDPIVAVFTLSSAIPLK